MNILIMDMHRILVRMAKILRDSSGTPTFIEYTKEELQRLQNMFPAFEEPINLKELDRSHVHPSLNKIKTDFNIVKRPEKIIKAYYRRK